MAYKIYKGSTEIKKLYAPVQSNFNISSNYIKVGSPTISNNVASGFSTSNYLTLNNPINIGKGDYEIVIKFKAGSQNPNSSYQAMYYQGGYILSFCLSNKNTGFVLHSNTGDGSAWNSALNGTTEIPVGKIGWAKFARKNGVRSQFLSYDGITWTNEGSKADTNNISGGVGSLGHNKGTQVFMGSIYLADSTFNINGTANIKKVYKGSTLIYNSFEAPQIDQPWFTSNTTNGFVLDDDSHRDNIYALFNGTSNYGVVRRTWKDKWVSIKYPQQVVLDKYIITNENGGAFNQEPTEWRIEGSNNGTNWVQVDYRNVDRHVTGTVTTYTVTMPEETKYQWYRIYFLNGVIRDTYGLLRRIQFFTKAIG